MHTYVRRLSSWLNNDGNDNLTNNNINHTTNNGQLQIASLRFRSWSKSLGEGLGKTVVELTGEAAADLKLLERGTVIVSTAQHWDALSRRWKQRKNVQVRWMFCFVVCKAENPLVSKLIASKLDWAGDCDLGSSTPMMFARQLLLVLLAFAGLESLPPKMRKTRRSIPQDNMFVLKKTLPICVFWS